MFPFHIYCPSLPLKSLSRSLLVYSFLWLHKISSPRTRLIVLFGRTSGGGGGVGWKVLVWGHVCLHVCMRALKRVCLPVSRCHPTLENDLLKWNYAAPWPTANGMSLNLSSSWAVNKIWLAMIWLCCWCSISRSSSFLLSPLRPPSAPYHGGVDLRVNYYSSTEVGSVSGAPWWR